MPLSLLLVLVGLGLLALGADRFVSAAAALARGLGVSPLLVGLVVVGTATSAPEIFAGVAAALQGRTCLAIGNAIGSNIANVGLVLGLSTLLVPITVVARGLAREFALMFLALLMSLLLLLDLQLSRVDGWIMIAVMSLLMAELARTARGQEQGQEQTIQPSRASTAPASVQHIGSGLQEQVIQPSDESMPHAAFRCLVAAVLLSLGAELLVRGAVSIAVLYGLSDLVIGLTVVAVGTSLPELAAALASIRRGQVNIAVGTVIGSNMFNALVVMAVPGIILPGICPSGLLFRDFPVMIGLTVLMGLMIFGRGQGRFSRPRGAILLLCFLLYQLLLYRQAIL